MPSWGDPIGFQDHLYLAALWPQQVKDPLDSQACQNPSGFYPFPFSLIFCKSHNLMAVILIQISFHRIFISFHIKFIICQCHVTLPIILSGFFHSFHSIVSTKSIKSVSLYFGIINIEMIYNKIPIISTSP